MIPEYSLKQIVVGLEQQEPDYPLLKFLGLFSKYVAIESAYFLHVVPDFSSYTPFPEEERPPLVEDYEIGEELVERMETQIKEHIPGEEQIFVEYEVKEGDPLEELLLSAQDRKADLTVIGQRTRTDQHGILARNIARKLEKDALIIPDESAAQLGHILVPIDFSRHSIKAYQTALAINAQLEKPGRVTCLHIYESPDLSVYKISKTPGQFQDMIRGNREEALETFVEKYTPKDTPGFIQPELIRKEHPSFGRYIHDYSRENHVDMVIMGAKGHSKVELLFIGSVTEQFLSLNHEIPTLIIKQVENG